MPHSLPFVIAV